MAITNASPGSLSPALNAATIAFTQQGTTIWTTVYQPPSGGGQWWRSWFGSRMQDWNLLPGPTKTYYATHHFPGLNATATWAKFEMCRRRSGEPMSALPTFNEDFWDYTVYAYPSLDGAQIRVDYGSNFFYELPRGFEIRVSDNTDLPPGSLRWSLRYRISGFLFDNNNYTFWFTPPTAPVPGQHVAVQSWGWSDVQANADGLYFTTTL